MRAFLPKLRNRVNMTKIETSYIQIYGLMRQRKSTNDVHGKGSHDIKVRYQKKTINLQIESLYDKK